MARALGLVRAGRAVSSRGGTVRRTQSGPREARGRSERVSLEQRAGAPARKGRQPGPRAVAVGDCRQLEASAHQRGERRGGDRLALRLEPEQPEQGLIGRGDEGVVIGEGKEIRSLLGKKPWREEQFRLSVTVQPDDDQRRHVNAGKLRAKQQCAQQTTIVGDRGRPGDRR